MCIFHAKLDATTALKMQDILLVGRTLDQKDTMVTVDLPQDKIWRAMEALAATISPERLASNLLHTHDAKKINRFISDLRQRCEPCCDQLDPEVERLLKAWARESKPVWVEKIRHWLRAQLAKLRQK